MKKQALILLLLLTTALLLSSCITIRLPAKPTETPVESQTGQAFGELGAQTEPTPGVQQTATEEPETTDVPQTAEPLVETAAPGPADIVQGKCAYITGMSMRMDGQTDIVFDYVDWLSGDEAKAQYLQDNPGSSDEDVEGAGIYEIGYIRNVNNKLRTFATSPDTKYFLPDPMNISTIVEVSYDEFRDRMFPAVETGVNGYLTFVKIDIQGETLTKVEWLYLP